jgi:hypothetical protein
LINDLPPGSPLIARDARVPGTPRDGGVPGMAPYAS